MGCFNTIYFKCPKCQEEITTQSKGGSCDLGQYHLLEASFSDLAVVVEESLAGDLYCPHCSSKIKIHLSVHPTIYWDDDAESNDYDY